MATEKITNPEAAAESALTLLFIEQLEDMHWAEKKLVKALGDMIDEASSPALKKAFTEHREQTREHVHRLDRVFSSIGEEPDSKKCRAMAGIISEAEEIIDETEPHTAQRDAGLIMAAQKAEHYEIATYGGLAQLAETLGFSEAKALLGQTLEEEKQADERLTQIARSDINIRAAKEPADRS